MIEKQEIVSRLCPTFIEFGEKETLERIFKDALFSCFVRDAKSKIKHYPQRIITKKPIKKISYSRSRHIRSKSKKSTSEKVESDDGEPHRKGNIVFTNCTFNIENSKCQNKNTDKIERTQNPSYDIKNLIPKAKKSYLTIIAALCNKNRKLDITSPHAVSILQTEIEGVGLKLGDDTIRKIIKEVRDIMNK